MSQRRRPTSAQMTVKPDRQHSIPSLDGLSGSFRSSWFLQHTRTGCRGLVRPGGTPFARKSRRSRIFFHHFLAFFDHYTLLLNERQAFGSISLRLFYARRALRILPAFLLFVATVAVLKLAGLVSVPGVALSLRVNLHNKLVSFWTMGAQALVVPLGRRAVLHSLAAGCGKMPEYPKMHDHRGCTVSVFAGIVIRAIETLTGLRLIDPQLICVSVCLPDRLPWGA